MSENKLILRETDYFQRGFKYREKLNEYMQQNLDVLIEKFLVQFEQYCRKITLLQEKGKKNAIGFINFSVLRTNILARRHIIRLDAYDENWYADRVECSGEYDVLEIYIWLEKFADSLEATAKSYSQSILGDIQRAVFEESNNYLLIVAELVRMGLKKAAKMKWFQQIKRNELFVICIGGFQDKSDILYIEDTTAKDARSIKRHLEEKLPVYTHEICNGLDLSGGDYKNIHLLYSNFSGCDFSGSNFNKAVILFSDFKHTDMSNVVFENSEVIDTDFGGAKLENVSFQGAMLRNISFAGARLINVKFEGAILAEQLDFGQAALVDTVIPEKQVSR